MAVPAKNKFTNGKYKQNNDTEKEWENLKE
jgi:hypothetical protein